MRDGLGSHGNGDQSRSVAWLVGYSENVRFLLIPILAVLCYGRNPSRNDALDLNQAIKLESNLPCDGVTNPQQEIVLEAHFSTAGGPLMFIVNTYQDETCLAGIGIKCFKHTPAGWRDDLMVNADGISHYWLNSCKAHGSKDPARYTLSAWFKDGTANTKKLPWKQGPLKQVSAQPEVYEFTGPNGDTARVEITRR